MYGFRSFTDLKAFFRLALWEYGEERFVVSES